MHELPCQGCHGLCCGPVPVTESEIKKIRKKIKSMPKQVLMKLRSQPRPYGTCMFYDLEQDRCGIYSARPEICRAFGYHKNLVCVRNPEAAKQGNWESNDRHVGLLTWDITWQDFDK